MTESVGYTLKLYCDHGDPTHVWEFNASTRFICVEGARDEGWVFHKNGTHSCPKCRGKGVPSENRF